MRNDQNDITSVPQESGKSCASDKLSHIEPVAYFLPEFCRKFCLSRSTFYREVHARRLRVLKRGKRTLIERTEAERWYASLPRGLYPVRLKN